MKKNALFALICILISYKAISQDTNELDRRNGFKDIHLGDAYSKWAKDMTFYKDGEKGEKLFFLNPSKLSEYSVFDQKTDGIVLYFLNNSIKRIKIETDYLQKPKSESGKYTDVNIEEIKPVLINLSELFGKPDYAGEGTMSANELFMFAWKGKKVILKLGYINGPETGSFLRLNLYSVEYLSNDLKTGF